MTYDAPSPFRITISIGSIAAITLLYFRVVSVNPTTVALTYVVAILALATTWGIVEAMTASLVAVGCFNFFFLPPIGQWTIADPQNWVAFIAFLITAIVTSQLSGRARRRTIDSLAQRADLERLYSLSRALLLSEPAASIPGDVARHIADTFGASAVSLYDHRTGIISRGGSSDLSEIDARLREIVRQRPAVHHESGAVLTPIQLGGAPIGSLAILGGPLSDTVLQSIANLAAIALERARGQETAVRAEAARQSGELRATVLDALAHEFKTPLTSLKAAAGGLAAVLSANASERELVSIVGEETDRLQTLVSDAIQMLRIDSGTFAVHRERHNLARLVALSLAEVRAHLDGRVIVNNVPPDLKVDADSELLGLALRQLLDNATKYSPASSSIEVSASSNDTVHVVVRNSGALIAEREHARIFERFYRGVHARLVPGTGMGLAIVQQIAKAHGGAVTVSSTPEAGTAFTLSLPSGQQAA
jgi:two-component system sensor histidine kinase KdpD